MKSQVRNRKGLLPVDDTRLALVEGERRGGGECEDDGAQGEAPEGGRPLQSPRG